MWNKDEPQEILLARLKAVSPETAYEVLQARAEYYLKEGLWRADRQAIDELESALQARSHPLIALALAHYGISREVVGSLYERALGGTGDTQQDMGIRLSVLANRILPLNYFSLGELRISAEELRRLALEGSAEEIRIMLQNPSCAYLLRELYNQKPPFNDLPTDRLRELVQASIPNERINLDESDENGPDMAIWEIHKGIWHLLETAPVEMDWLWTLDYLLFNLDPSHVHTHDINFTGVLDRWSKLKAKKAVGENPDEDDLGAHTGEVITAVDEFRCLIAALYGKKYKDGKSGALGSKNDPDIVLRCAYYGNAIMKPQEMKECEHKDGSVFVYAALCNDNLFADRECRSWLEAMISGGLRQRYANRCQQIAQRHKYFDPKPVSESGAAVLEDIIEEPTVSAEFQALSKIEIKVNELFAKVAEVKSMSVWALVGIVALVIWRL